jgi:glycosyltransferase involved in cell wall biosynthesis
MPMKHILYIITMPDTGGAQRHVVDLASRFVSKGARVSVITGGRGPMTEKLERIGAEVFPAKNLVREISPLKDLLAITEIGRYIRLLKPDIVSCHSSKSGVIGRVAATLFSTKPRLFTAHGFVFHEFQPRFIRLFYAFVEFLAGFFTDLFITVSERDRQKAIGARIADASRVVTIHNGIEISPKRPVRKPIAGCGKIKLLAIGRLVGEKDYPTMLRMMRVLEKIEPERFTLEIAGDGPLSGKLASLSRELGIEKSVAFLGSRDDTAALMDRSDVFVMSSVKEGFPYALLEAAACMLPVVATDAGGIGEFIKDNSTGMLSPPGEPELLAYKIVALARDEGVAERLARNAFSLLERSFTLDGMFEKTCAAYERAEKLRGGKALARKTSRTKERAS